MCNPSSGAGGFSTAGGGAAGVPGTEALPSSGAGGGAECTVKKRASGAEAGATGSAAALDPHLDVAAFQFELGDVLLD